MVILLGMEQDEGGEKQNTASTTLLLNVLCSFGSSSWALVTLNNVDLFLRLSFFGTLYATTINLTFFTVCILWLKMLVFFKAMALTGCSSSRCPSVASPVPIALVTIDSFMIPKTVLWAQIFLLSFRLTSLSVYNAPSLRSLIDTSGSPCQNLKDHI